jgi:hypothetical protein
MLQYYLMFHLMIQLVIKHDHDLIHVTMNEDDMEHQLRNRQGHRAQRDKTKQYTRFEQSQAHAHAHAHDQFSTSHHINRDHSWIDITCSMSLLFSSRLSSICSHTYASCLLLYLLEWYGMSWPRLLLILCCHHVYVPAHLLIS